MAVSVGRWEGVRAEEVTVAAVTVEVEKAAVAMAVVVTVAMEAVMVVVAVVAVMAGVDAAEWQGRNH